MNPTYQSLAYFMRRPTGFHTEELTPFYRDVVGLPVMRDYGDSAIIMWAGEYLVFEIKCDDHPPGSETDPASAACIPIFRSHDLAATRERLAAHGYAAFGEQATEFGQTAFILGPDGHLIGFQERSGSSPLAADREALERWQRGDTRLAELPALPQDIQYLSRVVRHVADVDKVSDFYECVFGLDLVGREGSSVLFDLGDTVLLEIAPGGAAGEIPEDRSSVPNSIIVRIHEFEDFVDGLKSRGARFSGQQVNYTTGTKLLYVADTEGNLTGIEERTLYGEYDEDVEADRRRKKRTAFLAGR